ncbi:MAG: ABC transporter permease, partial [Roseomonas sp.]|nr:ABC transporter permease [Roseomonas sp.]
MSVPGAALAIPPRAGGANGFSFGMAILGLALLVAIFGPSLAPHDPLTQELAARNAPPDALHWLGYDHLGRDVLARLVAGTRISLAVALGATLLAMLLGAGLGLAAEALGRWP